MASIAEQKQDLREIIHRRVFQSMKDKPETIHDVAIGAIRRLTKRMTLAELRAWNFALSVPGIMKCEQ